MSSFPSQQESVHGYYLPQAKRLSPNDEDAGAPRPNDGGGMWTNTTHTSLLLPSWTAFCFKSFMGITVALYILNQKHMLPLPISRVVSNALFWPTLPITFMKRMGQWSTKVDDTVVMGGAPFGFAGLPEKLYHQYDVSIIPTSLPLPSPPKLNDVSFLTFFNLITGPRRCEPL
jgi:hypothetical protein